MTTIREILSSEAPKYERKLKIQKEPKNELSLSFIDRAVIILGKNCPRCKELVESALFKEFLKAAYDRVFIAFDEEGYLYGADYSNAVHILERRVGESTPSVVFGDEAEILENSPTHIMRLAKFLGIPMVPKRRRSKKSEEEAAAGLTALIRSKSRSSRRRKKNTFVEMKQLKKEVKKAATGCLGEVCVEV